MKYNICFTAVSTEIFEYIHQRRQQTHRLRRALLGGCVRSTRTSSEGHSTCAGMRRNPWAPVSLLCIHAPGCSNRPEPQQAISYLWEREVREKQGRHGAQDIPGRSASAKQSITAPRPRPRPPVRALVPWDLVWWHLRGVRRSCVDEAGGRCSEGMASIRRQVDVVVKARPPFEGRWSLQ